MEQKIQIDFYKKFQGHKGMIHVAQYVLRTMQQESVLAEAFEAYPEYKLVVTGNLFSSHLLIE